MNNLMDVAGTRCKFDPDMKSSVPWFQDDPDMKETVNVSSKSKKKKALKTQSFVQEDRNSGKLDNTSQKSRKKKDSEKENIVNDDCSLNGLNDASHKSRKKKDLKEKTFNNNVLRLDLCLVFELLPNQLHLKLFVAIYLSFHHLWKSM